MLLKNRLVELRHPSPQIWYQFLCAESNTVEVVTDQGVDVHKAHPFKPESTHWSTFSQDKDKVSSYITLIPAYYGTDRDLKLLYKDHSWPLEDRDPQNQLFTDLLFSWDREWIYMDLMLQAASTASNWGYWPSMHPFQLSRNTLMYMLIETSSSAAT